MLCVSKCFITTCEPYVSIKVLPYPSHADSPTGATSTRVAKVAKVQKFPIKELSRPTGPHLIRVLSAICNFRAFADVEERQTFLLDLQQQAEGKQARLYDRTEALAEAEEELDTIQ